MSDKIPGILKVMVGSAKDVRSGEGVLAIEYADCEPNSTRDNTEPVCRWSNAILIDLMKLSVVSDFNVTRITCLADVREPGN